MYLTNIYRPVSDNLDAGRFFIFRFIVRGLKDSYEHIFVIYFKLLVGKNKISP